jgi:hypothetical protein
MRYVLHLLWIFLPVVLFAALYCAYVLFSAWYEVRNAPRAPMFLCNKHGAIRKEHLIHFQSSQDTWIDYCPICFHERLAGAEKVQ